MDFFVGVFVGIPIGFLLLIVAVFVLGNDPDMD